MVKFVEHRIADKRAVRLIQKWLSAGVLEDGRWLATEEGTPQGATISPLLANVYLHYVLDLWVQQWRKRVARGEVIIVRYADDFVMGFQHEVEAARFRGDLQARLERFGLEVHPDKTRLLEFQPIRRAGATCPRGGQAGYVRLPRLHAHLRKVEVGELPASPSHDEETNARQAAADPRGPPAASAPAPA